MKNLINKIIETFRTKETSKIHYDIPDLPQRLARFQQIIRYHFTNIALLKTAITHDSVPRSQDIDTTNSPYERMEFLGDAVLGLIVCEHLFSRFPYKSEGFLSKLKSHIVSEKFLALKANDFKLPEYIILSDSEAKNGGRERKSIIADTVEALICAIYLDGGLEPARKFITTFIVEDFEKQLKLDELINYKSILQEHSQGKYQKTPFYKQISETGPDHNKVFVMEVYINDELLGKGEGPNKKEAQQKAAQDACKKLNIN